MKVDASFDGERVLKSFDALETQLEDADLPVSLSALTNINRLQDTIKEIRKLDPKITVTEEHQEILRIEMATMENIVFSESRIKKIYIIPQRRYNSSYLLNEPEKLLKNGTLNKLSDIARYDFLSACRCLAFGESTASAFHILRTTEDTLKHVYFEFKKTNRLDKPMWGPMTDQLRNKTGKKPDETTLNTLDLVRTSYRNPTQHPLVTYDIDSAQDLFGICLDLINKLAFYL